MHQIDLNDLEYQLLQILVEDGPLKVADGASAVGVAHALGVKTEDLAAAKNGLVACGYAESEDPLFAGGASVTRVTDRGLEAWEQLKRPRTPVAARSGSLAQLAASWWRRVWPFGAKGEKRGS